MNQQRIPVTVIGGFLGAGKTTLVNHLIMEGAKRFGIIVNEFGKLGIDGGLIERLDPEGVAELTNGCLCCVGRNDLVESLVKLAMRPTPPEHVLIELSGVADPVPVLQTLLDPVVRSAFDLHDLVVVVDAKHFNESVRNNPETLLQLSYATTIVINKLDIASFEEVEYLCEQLSNINPLSRIFKTRKSEISAEKLLSNKAFSLEIPIEHTTIHTKGIKSFSVKQDKILSMQKWHTFMQKNILDRPDAVLRVKGYLCFENIEDKVLFQAVRDIFSAQRIDEKHTHCSELVVIGTNLDSAQYQAEFDLCVGENSVL